jgi:enediyne biosynthesis protein E4
MVAWAACSAGAQAVQRRDWTAAGPLLEQCIKSGAAGLDAYLMLSGVYQAQKDDVGLLRTASAGLRRFPGERRFYLTSATILGRRQDYGQAADLLESAAKRWPDDMQVKKLLANVLFARGVAQLDAGENEAAAVSLERAAASNPEDAEIHMNLGRAQHNLQRYPEAIASFDTVGRLSPSYPMLHFHRGMTHNAAGAFAKAVSELTAQISADSGYGPAYLVRGLANLSLGNLEPAVADLRIAVDRMPGDSRARAAYARALLRSTSTSPPGVPAPIAPRFVDTTEKSGIAIHVVNGDSAEKKYLLESMGGGVAVIDYDNDGRMDIYFVNGSTIAEARAGKPARRSVLYRNNGDGTFKDVTESARLLNRYWGQGVLAADLTGDGFQDLYLLNFGPNVLYVNNGDGTFRDATKEAGVGDPRWSSAAAAADYDKDGDLDLFVANYVGYDLNDLPTGGEFCTYRGAPVSCGPRGLKGAGDTLYRNNGDGTFTDVSKQAGVNDAKGLYGLGAAWGDYDNDGDPDLFVANDATPNYLYRNDGGKFTDVAVEAGVALSEDGREQSGMGVEFEDLDNDGWLDIMVTNFSEDYNTFYRNTGQGYFRDESARMGLVADSWRDLSWGVGFFDFNNDGWKDVFIANGHIYPQVDRVTKDLKYKQANKLYINTGAARLQAAALPGLKSYRGAAFADFNNDGFIDIIVSALDERPTLLMNQPERDKHWLTVALVGSGANRFGVGARVEVTDSKRKQHREVKAGGSYASSNDPRLHFGVGASTTIDEVRVIWPSGKVSKLAGIAADRIVTIHEEKDTGVRE